MVWGNKESLQITVKSNASLYKKFKKVLELDENITDLFTVVAYIHTHQFKDKPGTNVVTRLENILIRFDIETRRSK